MNTVTKTLATALLASMAFAGAAHAAEGEYYEGIGTSSTHRLGSLTARSIQPATPLAVSPGMVIDSGDYYQGGNRNR